MSLSDLKIHLISQNVVKIYALDLKIFNCPHFWRMPHSHLWFIMHSTLGFMNSLVLYFKL
jgi:hypothetical protein